MIATIQPTIIIEVCARQGRGRIPADQDGDFILEHSPDEISEALRWVGMQGLPPLISQFLINIPYQTLRTIKELRVLKLFDGLVIVIGVHTFQSQGNDILVPADSGLGLPTGLGENEETFDDIVTGSGGHSLSLDGAEGRNHASVANAGVAEMVGPWLIEVEREKGDLR